jgi:hypothetical protein
LAARTAWRKMVLEFCSVIAEEGALFSTTKFQPTARRPAIECLAFNLSQCSYSAILRGWPCQPRLVDPHAPPLLFLPAATSSLLTTTPPTPLSLLNPFATGDRYTDLRYPLRSVESSTQLLIVLRPDLESPRQARSIELLGTTRIGSCDAPPALPLLHLLTGVPAKASRFVVAGRRGHIRQG